MAEKIDGIEVRISANTSDFNKGMASAKTALASFDKDTNKISAGMVAFGSAVGTIFGNVITKAFGALSREMDGAISRFDSINNFPKVMANLGIGAKDSQAAIDTLSDKLLGLPTTLDAGARAVQRFTSANSNVKASTAMFLALNNAILAGGADMSVQSTALEQLSQAYAKGKPDMMEWRSAMTAMPAQLKQVANAMGYVDASALGEALRSGTVSMNDFMATLVKLNKTGINGLPNLAEQAKNATGGVSTSIVNMKTAIQRGLADIMNAIGQSNIAAFFSGVARAIGTAANYIAAFVKVAASAVNALAGLFGGKAKTSVASNVETATKATNSLKTSVGGVSTGLDKATGSAKKLKNQLASFDEMNVINEPESGGGGASGGGASGGGGGSIGDIDYDDLFGSVEKGASEVDKIFERMQKTISKLDFSKWAKAIDEFKKGAQKAFAIASSAANSFMEKELKPLAKFFAEDLMPKTIEDIGLAFQRLDVSSWAKGFDTLFSGRATYLEGLYSTLEAIAGAVANVFMTMANIVVPPALSAIGAIFQLIGTVLQGIGEGFTTVWQGIIEPSLTSFAEFMQPVIDHLQTFFEKLSQCEPLMQTLSVIGKALGAVLGAAFAAIVGAVQAVIGAVMLLIDGLTHLLEFCGFVIDNIGKFFYELGANISDIFENVGKFIKSVWDGIWNALVTVFTPVVNFFGGIFKAVGDVFTGAWNGLKNGAQGAWNAIKSIFSNVANFFGTIFGNAWQAVKNVFSTGGKIFMGIVDGVANAFKTIVNAIITGINKVVAIPFNAINGMLDIVRGIDILGIKPFSWVGKIGVPQIPKLAKGGVVNGATLAMVGEQGREAIVPLEKNTEWITELAKQINSQGAQPTQIIVKVGEDTLIDKVIDGINQASFLQNRGVINI